MQLTKSKKNTNLFKKLASKNPKTAKAAQQAFAKLISAPIMQVIQNAPVMSNLFATPMQNYDLVGTTLNKFISDQINSLFLKELNDIYLGKEVYDDGFGVFEVREIAIDGNLWDNENAEIIFYKYDGDKNFVVRGMYINLNGELPRLVYESKAK